MIKDLINWSHKHWELAAIFSLLTTFQVVSMVRTSFLQHDLANAQLRTKELETKLVAVTEEAKITNFELDKVKGNVAIIDGAVNSEGKRKQRIIKVRDVIRRVAIAEKLEAASALEPSQLSEMATAIVDRADAEHIPVALLMGVIRQESGFNPEAVSKTGAQGLTQVMPSTADDIKQWTQRYYYEPFRISHNIQFGAYYLGRMMRKFEWNQSHAVMAYNGGPTAVVAYLADAGKLWPETIEYEQRVMFYKRQFESLGVI